MKNEHVLGELSSYIDGEAKDPEGIARHLQQCPSCARRYMELSKVSSHLRALRGPEVHPAFRTRVMAEIAEVRQAPNRARWSGLFAPVVAALAVVCVAGTAFVYLVPRESTSVTVRGAFTSLDANRIMEEIERRVAEGEEVTLALPVIQETNDEVILSSLSPIPADGEEDLRAVQREEIFLEAIATSDWSGGFPVALSGEPDVSESIEALDEAERAVFKELLIQYALEDVTS